MSVTKTAYFYSKTEVQTDTEYKDGWHEWYMDLFKEKVHVLDDNGNDIIAEEDTVYLVPPNTRMYFKYDNISSFVHTAWLFLADRDYMDSLEIPYRTPIKIHDMSGFERLLYDMEVCQRTLSKFSQRQQDIYLELILMFIHNELHGYSKDYSVKRGDDLHTLRSTVMNSLAFPWTIKIMAEKVNMSASTFQRQYKHLYGKTPIADLYDMRFIKAKRLIETGFSFPWILNSCCFKSFQHFSRFFKEREGISPSEYRNRVNTPFISGTS